MHITDRKPIVKKPFDADVRRELAGVFRARASKKANSYTLNAAYSRAAQIFSGKPLNLQQTIRKIELEKSCDRQIAEDSNLPGPTLETFEVLYNSAAFWEALSRFLSVTYREASNV